MCRIMVKCTSHWITGSKLREKGGGELQVMLKPQKVTEHIFKSWLHLFVSLLLASLEDINFVKAVSGLFH